MEQEINVKALRERLNATQRQIADAVDVDQSTVSDWETGRSRPRGPAKKLLLSLKAEDFVQPEAAE